MLHNILLLSQSLATKQISSITVYVMHEIEWILLDFKTPHVVVRICVKPSTHPSFSVSGLNLDFCCILLTYSECNN